MYTSDIIRKLFINFFTNYNHKLYASANLLKSDTTLFNIAGMQQFRKYFLEEEVPIDKSIITIQKCLRIGGNKCDIENIGKTGRHCTYFEMGGNFSFGSYFNKEAIELAYKFLTEVLEFPKEHLYFTTHITDTSSFDIWNNIAHNKVIALDSDDNFWSAGTYGPCGPCTEIFFDTSQTTASLDIFREDIIKDNTRFLEIWNIVLISFNKTSEALVPLEIKKIDTGFGLERMTAVYNFIHNITNITNLSLLDNYSTDLLDSIYNVAYQDTQNEQKAKILADHSRSIIHLLNENLIPGNNGREYVLRKLIRRMIVISKNLKSIFDAAYNRYIYENKYEIIQSEVSLFENTLRQGLLYLSENELNEYNIFKLYETYGIPLEISYVLAEERNILINKEIVNQYLQNHVNKSKKITLNIDSPCEIHCYDKSSMYATVIDIIEQGEYVYLVTDKSCFYAESGGQVGDIGIFQKDKEVIQIINTLKSPISFDRYAVLHVTKNKGAIEINNQIFMQIDKEYRNGNTRAHSSIHLCIEPLLRDKQYKSTGSHAINDKFRFDIAIKDKIDIQTLEDNANKAINMQINSKITYEKYENIKDCVLLDNCTYGETVRVVEFSGFSKQLCGGTHVGNTSQIKRIKLLSAKSIGSGIRRIEGICGNRAIYKDDMKIEKIEEISIPQEIIIDGIKGLFILNANQNFALKKLTTFVIYNHNNKCAVIIKSEYKNIISYFQNKNFIGGGKQNIFLGNKEAMTFDNINV